MHPTDILVRELDIIGSVGSTLQDAHDVVDLVARGIIRSVVDHTIGLENFEAGLAALEAVNINGRVVIAFE